MAQPAYLNPLRSPLLPVWDLEGALTRLPAEMRAQVAWTKAPAEAALARLAAEPITDSLLEEVARAITRPVVTVTTALWRTFAGRNAWQSELEATFRQNAVLLRAFVSSGESGDTLAWCQGFLRSLFSLTTVLDMDSWGSMRDEDLAPAIEHPDFLALMKAQASLLAALELARDKGDADRAAELIDVAFLELCELQDSLRRAGLWVSPFSGETPEERAERTLRYARQTRQSLSEHDVQVLEDARVRALR